MQQGKTVKNAANAQIFYARRACGLTGENKEE